VPAAMCWIYTTNRTGYSTEANGLARAVVGLSCNFPASHCSDMRFLS
jgi:hypothetical protein